MREIDLNQLPIPETWDIACPRCQYPLRGLPSHRCPECGSEFEVASLVGTWTRFREPDLCGRELPIPDFGLTCAACDEPLAGSQTLACPACGEPFDPDALRPRAEWFSPMLELDEPLPLPILQLVLDEELIPYRLGVQMHAYLGPSPTLTAHRDFFFDVLFVNRREAARAAAARSGDGNWECPHCGEDNTMTFEVCWNCQAARPAAPPVPAERGEAAREDALGRAAYRNESTD